MLPLTLLLIAGIFLADLWTPLGWAVWMLYVLPLWLHAKISPHRSLIPLAAVCCLLTVVGFIFSPSGVSSLLAGANRGLGMIVLGVATAWLVRSRRAEEALRLARDELALRVSERTDALVTAHEALGRTEEQFLSFMNHLSACAWIKDLSGAYVYANRYFREQFELAPNDLPGKTDMDLFAPETAAKLTDNDRHVMRSRKAVQTIETFQFQDGRHHGLVTTFPMFDKTGALIRVAGISIDITERTRAEELLRENEQQMRLFMLATNDIIWNWDLMTGIVTRSIGFEKVFGYSGDEIAPTIDWWKERVHPGDLRRVLGRFDDVLTSGETTCAYEYRFRRRDDSYAALSERIHIMRDRTGTPVRALGAMTDLTERKQAEDALRKSDEQLRKVMEEREQLAQDLHDNIIQSVYAIGLGLEECQQLISEDAAAAVGKLERAIADLNVVIRDVRNYIVGDESDLLVSAKQFRAELARLAQTMQGVQFPRFRVSLETIATSQLSPEEARHVLFIAREAMSNSLRHSGAKSGAVSFRRNHESLRLLVEDDGIGFDVNEASNGCGLRNMRARAQKLGAQLRVVSSREHGTRIIVDIPRDDAPRSA
ncbi:MAG TPA: PAS domain S-box protein [Nitrospiraceae bacterium]|nr:PAS domain S-box protein [Nitrospiraceae bacterium]